MIDSILLYRCTMWNLTKCMERKLNGNRTRMLWSVWNKSWWQNPTKQQLYGYMALIAKTIQTWRAKHAGYCWRNKGGPHQWYIPVDTSHGRASVGWPDRTYLQQICTDAGGRIEDLPKALDDWGEWRENVREIRASSMQGWWSNIYR